MDTPSDEMNVLYDIGSSNLWVPDSDDYGGTQVKVPTTIANLHLRRQQRHIQNRVRFESRSGFSSEDPVNRDEVSIADYTFDEMTDVSGLGFSYSPEKL